MENRRLERIAERRAMLVIGDVSYGVVDWSVDGFRVLGYRGGFTHGQELRGRLIIVNDGVPIHFNLSVRILRESLEAGEVAGQFFGLSGTTSEKLERIYRKRLALQQQRSASRGDG